MSDLASVIAEMRAEIEDLRRLVSATVRRGTVADVDLERQLVRLRLGGSDDEPFRSAWVPYAQHAGALRVHTPPTVGQTMTMLCEGGELENGVAVPLGWSNQNPSPSSEANNVVTFGPFRITLDQNELKVEAGQMTCRLKPDLIKGEVGPAYFDVKADQVRGRFGGAGRFFATAEVSALRFGDVHWIYADAQGVWWSKDAVVKGPPSEK